MRTFAACWRFWQMRGYLAEGREQAQRVIDMPDGKAFPEARALALEAAGGIAYWQADHVAAGPWYEEALEFARATGDKAKIANAAYNLGFTLGWTPEDQLAARALARESLGLYRELRDKAGIGRSLWGVANSYYFFQDFDGGQPIVDEALAIFREVGDRFMTGWALYMQGLYNLRKDRVAMRAELAEALPLFTEIEDKSSYALIFDAFAALYWLEGDVDRAVRLAGYADATERSTGTGLAKMNRQFAGFYPEDLTADPVLARAYAAGHQLTLEDVTRLALEPG